MLRFGTLYPTSKSHNGYLGVMDDITLGIPQPGGGSFHGKYSADEALESEGSHVQEQGSLVLRGYRLQMCPMEQNEGIMIGMRQIGCCESKPGEAPLATKLSALGHHPISDLIPW